LGGAVILFWLLRGGGAAGGFLPGLLPRNMMGRSTFGCRSGGGFGGYDSGDSYGGFGGGDSARGHRPARDW
jgi:hypothetical protein